MLFSLSLITHFYPQLQTSETGVTGGARNGWSWCRTVSRWARVRVNSKKKGTLYHLMLFSLAHDVPFLFPVNCPPVNRLEARSRTSSPVNIFPFPLICCHMMTNPNAAKGKGIEEELRKGLSFHLYLHCISFLLSFTAPFFGNRWGE